MQNIIIFIIVNVNRRMPISVPVSLALTTTAVSSAANVIIEKKPYMKALKKGAITGAGTVIGNVAVQQFPSVNSSLGTSSSTSGALLSAVTSTAIEQYGKKNGYNMSSAFRCFLWEFGYNLVGQQIEPSIVGALPSGLRGSLVLGQ